MGACQTVKRRAIITVCPVRVEDETSVREGRSFGCDPLTENISMSIESTLPGGTGVATVIYMDLFKDLVSSR